MAKGITLNELGEMMTHVVKHMATKEDIAGLDKRIDGLATKEQLAALHTQVNSIERHLRDTKIEVRLADLEEKVFGKVRA